MSPLLLSGFVLGCASVATEDSPRPAAQQYDSESRHPADRWIVEKNLSLSGSSSHARIRLTEFESVSIGFVREEAHRCPPLAMCIWNGGVFTYFEFSVEGQTRRIEIPFIEEMPQLKRWTSYEGYLIGMSPVQSQATEPPKKVLVTVARLCSDLWRDQWLALGNPVLGPGAPMGDGEKSPNPDLVPKCDVGP